MVSAYTIDYSLVRQPCRVSLCDVQTKVFTTKSNGKINSLRCSGFSVTSPLYSGEWQPHLVEPGPFLFQTNAGK